MTQDGKLAYYEEPAVPAVTNKYMLLEAGQLSQDWADWIQQTSEPARKELLGLRYEDHVRQHEVLDGLADEAKNQYGRDSEEYRGALSVVNQFVSTASLAARAYGDPNVPKVVADAVQRLETTSNEPSRFRLGAQPSLAVLTR